MTGSAKQIAWAKDIMDNAFKQVELCKATVKHFDDIGYQAPYNIEDINELEAVLKKSFANVTDASMLINRRECFDPERLVKILDQQNYARIRKGGRK